MLWTILSWIHSSGRLGGRLSFSFGCVVDTLQRHFVFRAGDGWDGDEGGLGLGLVGGWMAVGGGWEGYRRRRQGGVREG